MLAASIVFDDEEIEQIQFRSMSAAAAVRISARTFGMAST
jgi:hypothetical protein